MREHTIDLFDLGMRGSSWASTRQLIRNELRSKGFVFAAGDDPWLVEPWDRQSSDDGLTTRYRQWEASDIAPVRGPRPTYQAA